MMFDFNSCTKWVIFWNKDFSECGITSHKNWYDWLENSPSLCKDRHDKRYDHKDFDGSYDEVKAVRKELQNVRDGVI